MLSLEDISRLGNQWRLKEAISSHNLPVIVDCLRKVDTPLPVEIVHALADCIDPNSPTPKKTGRKPQPEREALRSLAIVTEYKALCADPEWARLHLNYDKEAFQLDDPLNTHDDNGRFSPRWKFLDMNRRREQAPLPAAGDIREFVCKMHAISARTFDEILAVHNRRKSAKP